MLSKLLILIRSFCVIAFLLLGNLSLSSSAERIDGPASIGTATLLNDGTIELRLISRERGMTGHATLRYPPSHPEYKNILDHLQGLKPGETKLVPPWPSSQK
jgi:hypothetical protein